MIFSASSQDELHHAVEHVLVVDHDLDVVDAVHVHARSGAWLVVSWFLAAPEVLWQVPT